MNKYAISFILIAILLSLNLYAQKSPVIATLKGKTITTSEYKNAYLKNNGPQAVKDSIEKKKNFLDLYVNFKMKIEDAYSKKMDQLPEVKNEIDEYKKKIGVTYLLEKKLVEPAVQKLYNRRKEEVRLSHIMFRPDSTGFDNALKHAWACLDSMKLGKTFEELARNNSQDLYSAPDGGDIYYITAGEILPVFEEVMYNTPPGTVYPEPVKTQFGYHLIKITERKPRVSEIRASHILVEVPANISAEDSAKYRDTINMIYRKVKEGMDFGELAKEFSKDPGSAPNGGDLGFFTRRMMVKPFDEAAFNLEIGQVSPIVQSQFGYHIIKVTDKKPVRKFEEERDELKSIYQRTMFNQDQKALVDSLKGVYNFNYNKSLLESISPNPDSITVGGKYWISNVKKEYGDKIVITYNKKAIPLDTLFALSELSPEFINRFVNLQLLENMVNDYAKVKLLEEVAMTLEKSYPEFGSLMDDYKNGILIFKLQEENIWNKIKIDSNMVKKYYEKTRDKYQWPDRVEFSEIYLRNDSVANVVRSNLKNGDRELFDTMAVQYTERPGYKDRKGYHGIKSINENQLTLKAQVMSEGQVSDVFKNTDGYSIVYLIKKHPAGLKTFEEAFAEASGGLQEQESKRLENEYLNYLKKKYNPSIKYNLIEKAFAN